MEAHVGSVEPTYIPIPEIAYTPEHLNSRLQYDRDSLGDLAASIREHGVIQPIVARAMRQLTGH